MRFLQRSSYFVLTALLANSWSSNAMAANGSQLIGVSPKNRAMGGIGVGTAISPAESLFKNPAGLSALEFGSKEYSAELGLTYVGLNTTADVGFGPASQSGKTLVPTLGVAYSADKLTVGFGMFGYSGVAVDHTGVAIVNGIKTQYKVVRFAAAGAYKITPTLSFGIEPFLTYSELALQTITPANSRAPHGGVGFGIQAGVFAKLAEGLTSGLNFTTGSTVNHKDIIDFEGITGATGTPGELDSFKITTPWEIGFGLNYKPITNWEIGFDWRYIGFGSSQGYRDYDWKSVDVLALGTAYQLDKVALRAGFNYSASPIDNTSGETGFANIQGHGVIKAVQSSFNIIAFPAFTQANITVGAGYDVSEDLGVDLAFLYAPKVSRTRSGNLPAAFGGTAYSYTGSASQWAIGGGVRYRM
jgi:long-chain fatty acid transport protein